MEVLGTVLGTAIQGQIVGQAHTPCVQDTNASTVALEGANRTQSATSLRETVRPWQGRGGGDEERWGDFAVILKILIMASVCKCWASVIQSFNMPTLQIRKLKHREAK